MKSLLKQPLAYLPIAMSSAAIVLLVVNFAMFGAFHQEDEGTAAHLWQLLIGGQFLP